MPYMAVFPFNITLIRSMNLVYLRCMWTIPDCFLRGILWVRHYFNMCIFYFREGQFEKAHTDFFEAFKNYDESGNLRRSTCLKYLVLANMLMNSDINPFDSQEAKPFKNDPEILAITNLVSAYLNND